MPHPTISCSDEIIAHIAKPIFVSRFIVFYELLRCKYMHFF